MQQTVPFQIRGIAHIYQSCLKTMKFRYMIEGRKRNARLSLLCHIITSIYAKVHLWNLFSFRREVYNLCVYEVGFPGGSEGKASVCDAGDPGLIPGSGSSPGEGSGNPLQYSCLDSPMDRGAWRVTELDRLSN